MTEEATSRASWGRIGGLRAWALNDPASLIGPANRGFLARFEREVDPAGQLDPRERAIRADRARRAYMLTLAAKSAAARKRKAPPAIGTPGEANTEVGDDSASRPASS